MYRYPLKGLSVREFLEKMHLAGSKVNWIVNDHKYTLEEDELLLDASLFNEKEINPASGNLDIIYQDEAILVVNKPKGIIIYSDNEDEVTLDALVANFLASIGQPKVARHIYRIDKDTSGLMVYALDPLTLSYLSFLNEARKLEKTYYCLCHGVFAKKEGTIDLPIARNRHDAKKMMVYKKGEQAITKYKVIAETNGVSLLAVHLLTGRTHQIRVHMSYLGHPIIGDELYGIKEDLPLQLEVGEVSLIHPWTDKALNIELPEKLHL